MTDNYAFKGAALAKARRGSAALEAAEPTTAAATNESDEQKYTWFKAPAPADYGENMFYFVNQKTNESRWEEPEEPYWIFNVDLQAADPEHGLQHPKKKDPPKAVLEGYQGYNPKIHGNYDPNADYAQYHNKIREQEAGYVAPQGPEPGYGAAMILNARTGNAQAKGPGAEHHNDAAKSGRQLNAFFDAEAAAHANEGKSLKEERQKQIHSKQQVREWKKAKKDSKRKKQMAFLTS